MVRFKSLLFFVCRTEYMSVLGLQGFSLVVDCEQTLTSSLSQKLPFVLCVNNVLLMLK